SDLERAAGVLAEIEVLDRERDRGMLADQVEHARVDAGEAALERLARLGGDHAAVEGGEPRAVGEHHAVARVGGAGIDAEDDHLHVLDSAVDAGRLQAPLRGGAAPVRASSAPWP